MEIAPGEAIPSQKQQRGCHGVILRKWWSGVVTPWHPSFMLRDLPSCHRGQGPATPSFSRRGKASPRSLPQQLPEIKVECRRDSQQRDQRGHPQTPFNEGDGLLGETCSAGDLVHGEAKAFPPLAQEAGGLFADFGS